VLETPSTVLTIACEIVFWGSAAYLLFRITALWLRVRRARTAYPRIVPPASVDRRVFGALLGGAVGDALGLPAERLPRWFVRLRYRSGPALRRGIVRLMRHAGDISDDTQLSIAVARSILPTGEYCHDRFRDELRGWHAFRVAAGRATTAASRRLWRDPHARGATASEGNGACTRVAPLALARARDPDERQLIHDVEQNARATHDSPVAVAAAVFTALLIKEALTSREGALANTNLFDSMVERLARRASFPTSTFERARTQPTLDARLRSGGTSGHAIETVTAALLVIREHPTDFAAAMRAVFFAGGDVDSIGAIVGSVLGANLGDEAIPEAWRAVGVRDYLEWLAARLHHATTPGAGSGQIVDREGNIAEECADVLVNAWNRNVIPLWLLLPRGVSAAIRRRGGAAAVREVSRRAPIPVGGATETSGATLNATWIVHAAGIDLAWTASRDSVRHATASALRLARWLGARTVALPLIGAGSGGLGERVARDVIRAECELQARRFDEIRIVALPRRSRRAATA
jgi:ADP-ribosylglycohydrolase/O-acetyl-ADP-ribose deacetylase (regulator of RNase III)